MKRLVLAIAPLHDDPKYAGAVYLTYLMLGARTEAYRRPLISDKATELFDTRGRPRNGWTEEHDALTRETFRQLTLWAEHLQKEFPDL